MGPLATIVGHRSKIASVPGGYYSRRATEAAAEAGIETWFTSEPTAHARTVNECQVLGRYTVQRVMGHGMAGRVLGRAARPTHAAAPSLEG